MYVQQTSSLSLSKEELTSQEWRPASSVGWDGFLKLCQSPQKEMDVYCLKCKVQQTWQKSINSHSLCFIRSRDFKNFLLTPFFSIGSPSTAMLSPDVKEVHPIMLHSMIKPSNKLLAQSSLSSFKHNHHRQASTKRSFVKLSHDLHLHQCLTTNTLLERLWIQLPFGLWPSLWDPMDKDLMP